MDYEEALAYMQSLHRYGVKLGNERFRELMRRLGDPQRHFPVAHVAGTKGKGSTTVMIAAILQHHGFRVGGYFSPYVYDVRERIQVDGAMVSRPQFASLVTRIAPVVETIAATPYGQTTEFELKTAAGLLHFAESQVDFAAIEVGLGGRLDATNVVEPDSCVITNIGLDHTQILGDTHARIAAEKAGILKPGVPSVTATDEPSALEVIRRTAAERGSPLRWVSRVPEADVRVIDEPDGFTVTTVASTYTGLDTWLRGSYQRLNAACAIAAVEDLARRRGFAVDHDAIRAGLRSAYLPARLETVATSPLVVMDGAHNALAATALAGELAGFRYRRLFLVVGMVVGHPVHTVVDVLAPLAHRVYATRPTWFRGQPAEDVAAAARRWCSDVVIITPPLEAARAALSDAGPDDLVLITGSFYTVGDVSPADLLSTPA